MAFAHGSCLCGEVKYSFAGEPTMQAICHCLSCRKLTGSTNTVNILVPTSAFTFITGANNLKSYTTRHESGLDMMFKFCPNCGTKIFKEATKEAFGDCYIVMAGTLDKDVGEDTMGIDDVKIGAELWTKHRVGWLVAKDGVAQCKEFV